MSTQDHGTSVFDLALGCPTRQSSGDDGSRSGAAVSGVPSGSFSFCTNDEQDPWWDVDLGATVPIGRIVLWNRDDAGLDGAERARPLRIMTSYDADAWTTILESRVVFGGRSAGTPLVLDSLLPLHGRHVRVQLERFGALHLDQVEIHASLPPLRWGSVGGVARNGRNVVARAVQWHDSGFFSNCSTTLETLVHLRAWGYEPDEPDTSRIYHGYRDHGAARDVHRDIFVHDPSVPLPPREAIADPFALFYAGHNHEHYRERDFEGIAPFMHRYFTPRPAVRMVQRQLASRVRYDPARTVALCWRGTDKHLEVRPTEIGEYIALADRLLSTGEVERVLIQTDQVQAREAVVAHFGDRCLFFDALPVSTGDKALHHTDLAREHGLSRGEFGPRLVAAIDLVAQARHVITHTGNVGLWIALLRGTADRLWQFDRECRLVPPPGHG